MISFRKIAKITLVLVYLVIVAGAVVRMTGSGMGCPDWPKCFGYYIPPTDVEQLLWKPQHAYSKGQIIIVEERLMVATSDFISTDEYRPSQWRAYTKHDYAVFNPVHTWVEYVNRLFGALSGFATLLLAIVSFRFVKTRPLLTVLSVALVFGMGFQAWLGATVVYSVLNPVRITLHMLMALLIVGMLIYLIHKTQEKYTEIRVGKTAGLLIITALLLTLVQVLLGTQVRQWVDRYAVASSNGFVTMDVPVSFYIHRTLSVLVLIINGYLAWLIAKRKQLTTLIMWVTIVLVLTTFSGVSMYYFDFPFGMQSLHLVAASVIFGLQYYLVLRTKR
ncbi:MAG: COX15/CtaA family protein [Capnocytophaga sp.]|nr:COX15/CtaA family protein [Capnocytophaga sp.]